MYRKYDTHTHTRDFFIGNDNNNNNENLWTLVGIYFDHHRPEKKTRLPIQFFDSPFLLINQIFFFGEQET